EAAPGEVMASAGGDAGAKGSFKPPPRFANVDDSTSERRLERRLGGAPSLERGGAMAKARPTVASHTVGASRPDYDQPGRLGGDHRVDSGEFGESAQSIGHGVAVAEQLGGAGADASRGQVRLHGLDQALPFDRAAGRQRGLDIGEDGIARGVEGPGRQPRPTATP